MIFPTIHNNGSDPSVLLEKYLAAAAACQEAIDLLEACSPNSRDYYVQSTEAMTTASVEYAERIQKMISVKIELSAIAEHIQQQMDNREELRKSHRALHTGWRRRR